MNAHIFSFAKEILHALPSGALHIPARDLLCVSDLHLGRSDRIARRTGVMIPPYENQDTLGRLADDIAATAPRIVICLGDSFDDLGAAHDLPNQDRAMLAGLQAGRKWIWIEGNHDPGPVDMGGTHLADFSMASLVFRHIATTAGNEVSGHFHPKFGLPGTGRKRACFIYDQSRLILPAYGAYTGGMDAAHPDIAGLFTPQAIAVLTGKQAIALPLCTPMRPRHRRGSGG